MIGVLRGWIARCDEQISTQGRLLLATNWAACIWALSSLEGRGLGVGPEIGLLFNAGHVLIFGMLAALIHFCGPAREPGASLRAIGLAFSWALLDEWHQSFVPGRDSSLWDVGSDFAGAVMFTGAAAALRGAAPLWLRRTAVLAVPVAVVTVIAATFA